MLVEDDYNLGFVIQDKLKDEGFEVHLCTDGVEGLKKFNEMDFQMCIFDVMMPKKDGFTLARDVRKLNKNVPILFLTAKNQTEDRIEGFVVRGFVTEHARFAVKRIRRAAILEHVVGAREFAGARDDFESTERLDAVWRKQAASLCVARKVKGEEGDKNQGSERDETG